MLGLAALALLTAAPVQAGSRILATGGVTPIEGGGGGGLSPWALITGYASSGETGVTSFATRVDVKDFRLTSMGAAVGWNDRLELSFARQELDVTPLDTTLEQDVFGLKARVSARLLYSRWPQISIGVQHKRNRTFELPAALGAGNDSGTDFYVSAAKLWFAALLERNVFANVTLRHTEANETGLLGFDAAGESAGSEGADIVAETSVGVSLNERWAVGYEYRQKPDRLASVEEQDWQDVFVAFFPSKHVSVTGAWVDLDAIANLPGQDGWYLSVQASL
jgi:hypothetical protein